jgi:hypothetical protein
MPVAVTADVPIGFVVDQVIVTLQLLAPDAIIQDADEELMEPVGHNPDTVPEVVAALDVGLGPIAYNEYEYV